jgi:hypothetical protein
MSDDEERQARLAKIEGHKKAQANVQIWADRNLKPISGIDNDYQVKALEHNKKAVKSTSFLSQRGDYQAMRVAFEHGLISGCQWGGAAGLIYSMYSRRIRVIPMWALATGATYGALLCASASFRFDL